MSNLKTDNTALSSQILSAQERIARLEATIASFQSQSPTNGDFPTLAKTVFSVRSTVFGAVPIDALRPDRRDSTSTHHTPYPPYQITLQAVETFFICNAISYPFLDKGEFLRDMEEAYAGRGEEGKEFVMFMVIAVGTTNRERIGEVERGSSRVWRARAMGAMQKAMAREDIVSPSEVTGGRLADVYVPFLHVAQSSNHATASLVPLDSAAYLPIDHPSSTRIHVSRPLRSS